MSSIVVYGAEPQKEQVWLVTAAWDLLPRGLSPGLQLEQRRENEKITDWIVHDTPPGNDGWVKLWGDIINGSLDLRKGDSLAIVEVEEELFEGVGVGDVIAELTAMFGIPPCNSCEERKKWLNKHLPLLYRRRRKNP